jgi:hypothetical protein
MASGGWRSSRDRERAWTCAALALALVLPVGPATAAPGCPPLAIEQTWIALLAQEKTPLSPAQRQALERSGAIRGFPVGLWPPSGPAPLAVGLRWMVRPDAPQRIELDADGDGVPEVSDTRDEVFGHTYRTPGHYAATIRVRDREGQVLTYRSPVTVLAPAAFDAELQGRWAALKDAVRRGDVAAALHCAAATGRRGRLEGLLRDVPPGGVERALPAIRSVEVGLGQAVYESVRSPDWGTGPLRVPLVVRFRVDLDGMWRVADVGFKGEEP